MKPLSFMLIAGEASGDMLAAELVCTLREKVIESGSVPTADVQPLRTALAPHFFGAGGAKMAAAGVELAFDMTQHSIVGIFEVLKNYLKFRRLFNQLFQLAIEQQPDVIIGVDYGGFNLRFGHAIKQFVRRHRTEFTPWNPKIVQFVSPQVWASRASRADRMAEDYDLLLSIFPFEKDWYAKRAPKLRVEYVGHPIIGRFLNDQLSADVRRSRGDEAQPSENPEPPHAGAYGSKRTSQILLLPGSRKSELQRHLPVMLGAHKLVSAKQSGTRAKIVLPNDSFVQLAKSLGTPADVEIQIGNLPEALVQADLAIASTGTVTMECAFFGVPTVTLYKTSWITYHIAKRIVTVKSLTMPNLLVGKEVFPEFIQDDATPENLSRAALELLQDENRRTEIKTKLAKIVASLGGPGASRRAAESVVSLLP